MLFLVHKQSNVSVWTQINLVTIDLSKYRYIIQVDGKHVFLEFLFRWDTKWYLELGTIESKVFWTNTVNLIQVQWKYVS